MSTAYLIRPEARGCTPPLPDCQTPPSLIPCLHLDLSPSHVPLGLALYYQVDSLVAFQKLNWLASQSSSLGYELKLLDSSMMSLLLEI